MSSHVVVLDSTARRATIKTTPGKYLTDILQEACAKLGVDASQHGLKYKSKQLDLSLAFRLSGLIPGAKLELVQLSRSPSVVNVALQLPPSEARGAVNGRVTDKFPSTTSIWMILRKFEAGVAGSTSIRNLTGRGVPVAVYGNANSGRLFYETPVVQILNRELSTLTDLEKSLAQLGLNSGNVLLRLSFRKTDQPLEEAMMKIHEHFKSSEDTTPAVEPLNASTTQADQDSETSEQSSQPPVPTPDASVDTPVTTEQPLSVTPPDSRAETPETRETSSRPVTVYAPPSNDTPQSAQIAYNENDYIPSVEHAQLHQRRLQTASKNTRLPTDAEIAAAAAAEEERRALVKEVEVKVRLPDQSQIVSRFGQQDTGKSLHDFVRSCLAAPYAKERFILTNLTSGVTSGPGPRVQRAAPVNHLISDSGQSLLIKDHNMTGRVLVNFSWDASASPAARQSRTGILKPELQTKAQELTVEQPPEAMDTSEDVSSSKVRGSSSQQDGNGDKSGPRKTLPKWLKLPGKK
ncbi:hypothetical protein P175DRAFT_0554194 [Aspergillus ochraceoroseus IBT 24754]|uniref:UBX domain-containing protein n=3 Tax=Aspergillus subgen. Nidulantes TaxID=2720870 RepID=A0A0F8XAQ5_9EURO|nr:uncharacterized protein P175DRAFT_0554194 [Aspergillus ochraceoroseus IBT 24754]KKK13163.1 hypothetical protein AOCH_001521 [Aspergillus ochraceoroseus]KKK20682.1 hypothetical protein ARAM_000337 [Aspergillus rambellii]PTU24938.1 hypothetical protein P175DRAFT_0554194 [Aspergillus ochraceoroseus IBT 24754]